ncbi:hypothetical protein Mapa_014734 [Marchantia paleacea]|nr:hypothetical protein Mapa_014734 [Marchantia paleacea]
MSHAKTYLKFFKSIVEKGDAYAKKEAERLERILSGAVSPNKGKFPLFSYEWEEIKFGGSI